jgi:hypothetical protein
MKGMFWMLVVMLSLLTLISALGGGIRYRENFFDEVLELQDINAELHETLPAPLSPVITQEPVAKPTPVKACKPPAPAPINTPAPAPVKSPAPIVGGYSGPSYASV